MGALYKGVIATGVLSLIGLWPLTELAYPRHGITRAHDELAALTFSGDEPVLLRCRRACRHRRA